MPIKSILKGKPVDLGWRQSAIYGQAHYWVRSEKGMLARSQCGKLAEYNRLLDDKYGVKCSLCERIVMSIVKGFINEHTK